MRRGTYDITITYSHRHDHGKHGSKKHKDYGAMAHWALLILMFSWLFAHACFVLPCMFFVCCYFHAVCSMYVWCMFAVCMCFFLILPGFCTCPVLIILASCFVSACCFMCLSMMLGGRLRYVPRCFVFCYSCHYANACFSCHVRSMCCYNYAVFGMPLSEIGTCVHAYVTTSVLL